MLVLMAIGRRPSDMGTHRTVGIALVGVLSLLVCVAGACGETTESTDGAGSVTASAAPSDETGSKNQEEDGIVDDGQVPKTEQAARAWLALVDEGRYEKSWDSSAALLRRAVTSERWAQQVGAAREPLGSVVSRSLTQEDRVTELPGAPDGEYAVLVFESVFDHKRRAVEQVTLLLEDHGAWRVAGYYIR
jgi:hypothetical protein